MKLSKMKLVTDGELWAIKIFACQRLSYVFYDLRTVGYWWGRNSKYFHHCWATKEIAEQHYARLIAGNLKK